MTTLKIYVGICVGVGSLAIGLLFAAPAFSDPLMGNRGWQPRQESSRASIAALMLQKRQLDNPATSYAGAVFTCGGGSGSATSTATANNNCTIVVDSDGVAVGTDQDSTGDQTAHSDATVTTNGVTESSLSDILDGMR